MSATYAEAYDAVLLLWKAAWDTTGYTALYENVGGKVPTGTTPWARVSMQQAIGQNASLSGALGTQRYERSGILFTQIFIPIGKGLSEGHALSKIVADAFEGQATSNGVWFRNTRINEVGVDGDWYQINVLTDFIYDEVK